MNKLNKLFMILAAMTMSVAAKAFITSGEYYIYNDFFDKALTANEGNPRLGVIGDNDAAFIFEAVNPSGDYVMLRHKASGKYLTASTQNTWSVLLSESGTGDQYYWKLNQLFSTTLVSKKNTGKRLGCDFKNGSTYHWNEDFIPVYYDKSASAMNWFSIIPANGQGFEASRKATLTEPFTNEYGVKEQDDYCVTEAVTVEGLDYHIISETPFDGGTVDLIGENSWLVFDNVRPSVVKTTHLSKVTINGKKAVVGTNCRVEIYLRGAVVIPNTADAPFVAKTDEGTFSIKLGNTKDLSKNSNKARSFVLKRGYMATVATGTNGGGYSRVYVADHADLEVTLPKALDQRITSVYVRNWHYAPKSGYAGSGNRENATKTCGASWYWNWDASMTSSADVEYIPIKQHLYWPSDANFDKSGSTAMMLFNEPEHSEQHTSNQCSCGGTIDAWKAYQNTGKFNSTGLRIGSPSATDLSYIKTYLGHCDDMQQRCDFSCTHGYWTSEWASNLNTLKSYGRPIWITEWEWGASWTSGSNPANADDARDKVLGILDMLEYNDYVERYSYYEWDTGGSNGWMREMFWENNPSKGCAYVGQVYKKVKPHLGYKASIQPVPNWWAPSFDTPEIKNVSLSNGKYRLSLKNPNGDSTKDVKIMKYDGSSWVEIASVTDRSELENTTLSIILDAEKLGESYTIKAVVTSLYSSGTKESAAYGATLPEIAEDPLDKLQNLNFDEGEFVDKDVLTYAKDIKDETKQVSGMQPVPGWTACDTGDAHASAQFAWGATYGLSGSDYLIPATNSEGTSEGGAVGILSCWTSTTHYTQDVVFPEGEYTLTVAVYNAGGTDAIDKNLIGFVEDNGTEHYAKSTSYPLGWTTETISFSVGGDTSGKLSVGYTAPNVGSSKMPHLFIDYIKISDGTNIWPKDYTGIIVNRSSSVPDAIYNIGGVRTSTLSKGINIVRTKEGRVIKIFK